MVALAGMDPMQYLLTTDELERSVMGVIAGRYLELATRLDQNRAVLIANAVWKAVSKK